MYKTKLTKQRGSYLCGVRIPGLPFSPLLPSLLNRWTPSLKCSVPQATGFGNHQPSLACPYRELLPISPAVRGCCFPQPCSMLVRNWEGLTCNSGVFLPPQKDVWGGFSKPSSRVRTFKLPSHPNFSKSTLRICGYLPLGYSSSLPYDCSVSCDLPSRSFFLLS